MQKLPSAELQMDKNNNSSVLAAQLAQQIKNNPLLKYLKEKGERKLLERRAARDKAKGLVSTSGRGANVTGVLSKYSGSSGNLTKTKVLLHLFFLIIHTRLLL